MGNASPAFLGFALAVVLIYNLGKPLLLRQAVLLIANFCFLATFSLNLFMWLPFAAFVLLGYVSVRAMYSRRAPSLFLPCIAGILVCFIWLKKYTFLPSSSFLTFAYETVGLSYILFRVLHLVIDARGGNLPEKIAFTAYLNYTLNFVTLICGPIQLFPDYAAMHLQPGRLPLTYPIIGRSLERIVIGLFKSNVLGLVLDTAHTQSLSSLSPSQAFSQRVAAGSIIAVSYTLFLYCNFSGYIDIVIGIGRLLRLRLPENFDRPFDADNFLTFWNRWHITLSQWLKTYFYNPLLMNLMKRFPGAGIAPFLGVFAYFATFFLVGAWHGQTASFLFYGVLTGLGVSSNKLYEVLMARVLGRRRYKALAADPVYVAFCQGLTFAWFTFTLLWFWSNWGQIGRLLSILGLPAAAAMWVLIAACAGVFLAFWNAFRTGIFALRWRGIVLARSRYVRTVCDTAVAVAVLIAGLVLNSPVPAVVYRTF